MIVDIHNYKKPGDINQKIFRFMDFNKFEYLVKRKSLFFSRLDDQKDVFEGKLLKDLNEAEVEYFRKAYDELSKNVYVSCWRMDDDINHKIWDKYVDSSNSVAIETTYKELLDSIISCNRDIEMGIVNYEYVEKKPVEDMDFIYMYKSEGYQYENELRAVILLDSYNISEEEQLASSTLANDHIDADIDLNTLIKKVYINPKASEGFKHKILELLNSNSN